MPRRPRHALSGVAFHVMNRAVRGTTLFEDERDFDAFARILREALFESRVEVLAYQVMRNHWHFVMTCQRIADLSTLMHRFEGRHANNWAGAHRARGRGYVYQGRFKSVPVQTSHSLFRVCRYVERNALRQNLVARAEDWDWGSLHARCNDYYPIPLSVWPIAPPPNWTELVNTPQSDQELADLRKCVRCDHPIGEEEWVKAVAPFVGMTLRAIGRPKK
ncbi:MAG: transposase [Vicinamibacterales bacterium]